MFPPEYRRDSARPRLPVQCRRLSPPVLPPGRASGALHPVDAIPDLGVVLSGEIFAFEQPILLTIDARSTTILTIALAAAWSAETK